MYALDEEVKRPHWGIRPQAFSGLAVLLVMSVGSFASDADPVAIDPDPPASTARPVVRPTAQLPPTSDLDGWYLWLGPIGAASHVEGAWDSTFGVEAAVTRVREREALGLIGGDLGATRWTVRDGGRIWLDGVAGTRLLGRMMGVSLGPIVELSETSHAHVGGSVGVWAHAGITPFARLGGVSELGMFAELGVRIALPVLRR
jgi:hypothetical protein